MLGLRAAGGVVLDEDVIAEGREDSPGAHAVDVVVADDDVLIGVTERMPGKRVMVEEGLVIVNPSTMM